MDLVETRGKTTCIITTRYDSREIRDGVVSSGAVSGMDESYAGLDEELVALIAGCSARWRPAWVRLETRRQEREVHWRGVGRVHA
jgi:hypothetical protein